MGVLPIEEVEAELEPTPPPFVIVLETVAVDEDKPVDAVVEVTVETMLANVILGA